MANTVIGTAVVGNTGGADSGSFAVTVPTGCDAIVAVHCGSYRGGAAISFDVLRWSSGSGIHFTEIVDNAAATDDTYDLSAHIMTATNANWPGTGAKTLFFGFAGSGDITEGGVICVFFLQDCEQDEGDAIIGTDSARGSTGTPIIDWASDSLGAVSSGDLGFVVGCEYFDYGPGPSGDDDGQTEIEQGQNTNSTDWAIGYEDGESVMNIDSNGTDSFAGNFTGFIAFALKQASGGGTIEITTEDAVHSHTADAAAITQTVPLTVSLATHGHTADASVVDTGVTLTVEDSTHAHAVDAPTLTQTIPLVAEDAVHAHTANDTTIYLFGVPWATLPGSLNELSGISCSLTQNFRYVIDDSGNYDGFRAIAPDGGIAHQYAITNANTDIEDIFCDGDYVYTADIGDNGSARSNVTIWRTEEPTVVDDGSETNVDSTTDEITVTYSDSAHNAETFFLDPILGHAYIITKEADNTADIYRIDDADFNDAGDLTVTASPVGSVNCSNINDNGVAGGDIHSSGNWIVLRDSADENYTDPDFAHKAWVWYRHDSELVEDALQRPPTLQVELVDEALEPKGEGIGFIPGEEYAFTTVGEVVAPISAATIYDYFFTLTVVELTPTDATHGHTADTSTLDVSGIVSLTTEDATHSHTADSSFLTQTISLVSEDAVHAHITDASILTQIIPLAVEDSTHAHTADTSTIDLGISLTAEDAAHTHTVDASILTQTVPLTVSDAVHSHIADDVTLGISGVITLIAEDAEHGHTAAVSTITQTIPLVSINCLHSHAADSSAVITGAFLTPEDAVHSHAADASTITQTVPLIVLGAAHAHSAGSTAITQTVPLIVLGAIHAQSSENSAVIVGTFLIPEDSTHSHTVAASTITQTIPLVVSDTDHSQTADTATITQTIPLVVSDSTHTQSASFVTLSIPDAIFLGQVILVLVQQTNLSLITENLTNLSLNLSEV